MSADKVYTDNVVLFEATPRKETLEINQPSGDAYLVLGETKVKQATKQLKATEMTRDELNAKLESMTKSVELSEQRHDANLNKAITKTDSKIDALGSKLDSKIDNLGSRFDSKIADLGARLDIHQATNDVKFSNLDNKIIELAATSSTQYYTLLSVLVAIGLGIPAILLTVQQFVGTADTRVSDTRYEKLTSQLAISEQYFNANTERELLYKQAFDAKMKTLTETQQQINQRLDQQKTNDKK